MATVIETEQPSGESLSAYGPARSTIPGSPLVPSELKKLDAYWRACNYLALGMIYLRDNPLLKEPLKPEHIKNRLLGHWGSSPGLAFIYVHLNRLIKKFDLDMGTHCSIAPRARRTDSHATSRSNDRPVEIRCRLRPDSRRLRSCRCAWL